MASTIFPVGWLDKVKYTNTKYKNAKYKYTNSPPQLIQWSGWTGEGVFQIHKYKYNVQNIKYKIHKYKINKFSFTIDPVIWL